MSLREEALKFHKENQGKVAMKSKVRVTNREELSLAYSPGVAEPCLEIKKEKETIYDYTSKGNFVAVVSNGTAVLGLGNLGANASLPVMEGKSILFKEFSDIDAVPICIDTEDVDKIVETVSLITTSFGGINLEDFKSPECFEIEERLKEICDIPVFHDDQHGTAVVVVSGLINALKLTKKEIGEVKVVVNGLGAAGTAISNLLINLGVKNLTLCDINGILYKGHKDINNIYRQRLIEVTNLKNEKGTLADALVGADVFIGVSAANIVTEEMASSMNKDAIIFAMANPNPEIMPELAKKAGVRIVGTGRSDMPNQINNVLAFPGIFKGALSVRATKITEEMKIAAAYAIASLIEDDELNDDYVIPSAFDNRVVTVVADAVAKTAILQGIARK